MIKKVENILQIFAPCRAALKKCYFELHKYLTKYMKPNDHSKIWTTLQYWNKLFYEHEINVCF